MYNTMYTLLFSFVLEFKSQLSTLSEEDNQCTTPTGECEYSMQCSRISDTCIQRL